MTKLGARENLSRKRLPGSEAKVEFVELFFDLVFVFAVTQISHGLLRNLTLLGAFQAAFLLMAVWWVWVYTSWVTNWMDPKRGPVKSMLFVLMLAGLLLSTSIPEAFAERGLMFAAAYVFMQVGRTAFTAWAFRAHDRPNYLNMCRILAWLLLSGVFWIAGALAEGEARFALWIVALLLEYVSPSLRFWTPWLGATPTSDWDIDGGHMAERSAAFIIIALGESVVVMGATLSEAVLDTGVVLAFLASFGASVAMWWLYFAVGAETGRHRIEAADDPGRVARITYTYLPVLLVAGIIVTAVADELTVAHPGGHDADLATVLTLIGGPALYVFGNLLFKKVTSGRVPLSHLVGLALLVVVGLVGLRAEPLSLSIATTVILFGIAYWEQRLGESRAAHRA
ncbi:MAG: low temperature requirement protein A [Mesorhizobium sp.]|nr:low temperature requirement protein A [Mesorhizobium sp.]MBN9242705.1 low temperature requirement protein A [Mesorhizobium sp.]